MNALTSPASQPIKLPRLDLRAIWEKEEPDKLSFVTPFLAAGTVGALLGTGGTSKSTLAAQIAVAITGGPDLVGLADMAERPAPLKTGKVVYLSAEDPPPVLERLYWHLGKRLTSEQKAAVAANLVVLPLLGRGLDLMDKRWSTAITAATADAVLIIIDTLRRSHQLDENDAADMSKVLASIEQICQATGPAALYLHHTGKSAGRNGDTDATAGRGSSVLVDNARSTVVLTTMTPEEWTTRGQDPDDTRRKQWVKLSVARASYSAPIADRWLRRDSNGLLEAAEPPERTAARKRQNQAAGGDYRPYRPAGRRPSADHILEGGR
jgi:hypothetical protein